MKREILEEILSAGIRAPSADNLQPWKFIISPSKIDFRLDSRATSDFAASGFLMLYVSVGAVIENIRVAALSKGFRLIPAYFPSQEDALWVASLTLEPVSPQEHPHQKVLASRTTNRRFYSKKSISPEVYARLEQMALAEGMKLLWIKREEPRYKTLERILGKADQLRYEVKRLHREFIKTLRFGPAQEAQDGLPIASLEAGSGSDLFFKWMSSWDRLSVMNRLGLSAAMGFYTQLQMESSEAAGLLITPHGGALDYAMGGEMMERLWHEASLHGLALQPMEALPIFIVNMKRNQMQDFSEKQQRLLTELKEKFESLFQLQEKNGLIMLWRVGYSLAPHARSNRRPVQSFIEEHENTNVSI